MKLRNPTGRTVRLEIVTGDDAAMVLTLSPHASVDLHQYQAALDALSQAEQDQGSDPGSLSGD